MTKVINRTNASPFKTRRAASYLSCFMAWCVICSWPSIPAVTAGYQGTRDKRTESESEEYEYDGLSVDSPTGIPTASPTKKPTAKPTEEPTLAPTKPPPEHKLNPIITDSTLYEPFVMMVEPPQMHKRSMGTSLSDPAGSPWCGGDPTIWPVGHNIYERPMCWRQNDTDSFWEPDERAQLDTTDRRNKKGNGGLPQICGHDCIDRHVCASMYVDDDDLKDIICFTGAGGAKGKGFSEIYLTQPDGSVRKVRGKHGLQDIVTMSTRSLTTLTWAKDNTTQLVFVGTTGKKRFDGKPYGHQVYKHTNTSFPYFERIKKGPWHGKYHATCAVTADFNQDGIDDILVCSRFKLPKVYLQDADGEFSHFSLPSSARGVWKNARVEDVTNDNIPDLIVAMDNFKGKNHRILIFEGQTDGTFDFDNVYYERKFRYRVSDFEILDVNGDGSKDIYVIQSDESKVASYCILEREDIQNSYFGGKNLPYEGWVPPLEHALDLIMIGVNDTFIPYQMHHTAAGCGYRVDRFGDEQTLVLVQNNHDHEGSTLLLQW